MLSYTSNKTRLDFKTETMDNVNPLSYMMYFAVAEEDVTAVNYFLEHGALANVRINTDLDPLERFNSERSQKMNDMLASFSLVPAIPDDDDSSKDQSSEPQPEDSIRRERSNSFTFFGNDGLFASKRSIVQHSKYNTWNAEKLRREIRDHLDVLILEFPIAEDTVMDEDVSKIFGAIVEDEEIKKKRIVFPSFYKWAKKLHKARKLNVELTAAKARREASRRRAISLMPTAMHQAARIGNLEIIESLVKKGKGNVNQEFDGKYAALDVAVLYNNRKAAELLIELGAKVNARQNTGKTALHHAVQAGGDPAMLELLLDCGAKVNTRTPDGVTPLHLAMERKNLKAVEILLAFGANVNARTKEGITPLHVAAVKGDAEIIELLVNCGVQFEAIVKDKDVDVSPLSFENDEDKAMINMVLEKFTDHPRFYEKLIRKMRVHLGFTMMTFNSILS